MDHLWVDLAIAVIIGAFVPAETTGIVMEATAMQMIWMTGEHLCDC